MRRGCLALLALLPLLGCAVPPGASSGPAAQHARLVGAADLALGQMIDHLAARERIELDQAASLRFAAAASVTRTLPAPATPAVGAVLDPGMDLVVIAAQRLAVLAGGAPAGGDAEAAAALARLDVALGALRGVPGRWPSDTLRRRGLDGFRTLAAPVPAGADPATLAAARQGGLAAGVALLQAVMGIDARSGLRGVLAQRHEAWREAQRGLLATGQRMDPAQRMALWNRVQAALAADGFDVPAAEVVSLLGALVPAQAAAGAGDAAGVAAFQAAVDRFQAVLGQAR
ncbi:hypothetical protein [Roseomonas fluvialis]|uniref:Uncharacterized protein n=1 Tax=Roseomonas fluvialis TaxID=1750527 RepID=A0ABN6P7D8_9PROT|nr:hypothetical protein [Roseomonas fluvialis]BDG73295.1 hypothetical protein Rmf_32240 [Roseomonas fluvialis]